MQQPMRDPAKQPMAPGVDGSVNTCTPSDAIAVQELQTTPAAFYVQVKADKGTLQGALK